VSLYLLGLVAALGLQPPPDEAPPPPPAPVEVAPEAAPLPAPPVEPTPAPAVARQGMDLSALLSIDLQVYAATKTATSAQDVAAVVTVVTADDISRWGYRSIAEVLQQVPGFYVIDDFIVPNAGVRGISAGLWGESGAIKVMIDGHAVPFRLTSGNWLGPELIPMSAIDHIEIVKGPNSVLYGADALLGVVNVVTRKDLAGATIHGGASYDEGSRLGHDLDMTAGTHLGNFEVMAGLRLDTRVRGGLTLPGSSPARMLPSYRDPGDYRLGELYQDSTVGIARVGYGYGPFVASVTGWISTIDRPGELSPWLQQADGLDSAGREVRNRIGLRQHNVALHLHWEPGEHFRLAFDGLTFGGGPTRNDHTAVQLESYYVHREFEFIGTDLNLEAQWRPASSFTAVLGAGLIYDHEDLLSTLHVAKENQGPVKAGQVIEASSTLQGSKNFINPAAYLQTTWSPLEQTLSLIGGLRYDHHNVYGDQLSARLGSVAQPFKDVYLKLLFGSAFKAPSPLLLYGVPLQPGDILGNRQLQAQHVRTGELELSYRPIRQLSLRSDVALSRLSNKAEFTQVGTNKIARNLAELEVLSWESSIEARAEWLLTYASFELQRSVRNFGEDGYAARLADRGATNYPSYIGRLGVELSPLRHLRLAGQGAYVGPRPASDSNALARGAAYSLPAYAIVNVSLSAVDLMVFPQAPMEISVYCRNVSDARAADPGFASVDYPIARRSLVLEVRQRF
jgi:outer membrane receptor for ferrienterochelin and colicins